MLAVRSGAANRDEVRLPRASLRDVCATLAAWLGVPSPDPRAGAIEVLLG